VVENIVRGLLVKEEWKKLAEEQQKA